MNQLQSIKKELKENADKKRAKNLQWFFKTGKGEYGEGDIFIGIKVPVYKKIAKDYSSLDLEDIQVLLNSKIHEERSIALTILVNQFKKGDDKKKKEIFNFYIKNTKNINNWDLVDMSSHKIVGPYLEDKDKSILFRLAKSKNLWERRIAIIATFYYIARKNPKEALEIAEILVYDKEDLIQKAVGWMLREIGKRCSQDIEEGFLRKYYKTMPRTMLRYSIERFSKEKRQFYMNKS